jgi:hypothetical protein
MLTVFALWSMVGETRGIIAHVAENVPKWTSRHCIISLHARALKKISKALKSVLHKDVNNINTNQDR